MIKQAKKYRDKYGYSVIPVMSNKKPAIPSWLEYQERYPTDEEIEQWWTDMPDCGIAIITGKISNIVVVDFDEDFGFDYTQAPLVQTPRGYHYYFKYNDGITNTVNLFGKKIDIRGEGGYVVAPPSINDKGKQYKWIREPTGELPEFPRSIFQYPLKDAPRKTVDLTLEEGGRDESLFHIAHCLIKGGMDEEDTKIVVGTMAQNCIPPFDKHEAEAKVDSAIKRAWRKERPLSKEIEDWVLSTDGFFVSTELYRSLQLSTRDEQKNVSIILRRLSDRGIIEKHGKRNACYRRIVRECTPIDWKNAPTNDMPLMFPLDLHELVKIYPGNIIVVAGHKGAGKTAFLLNFIKLNMDKYKIHYFNSEMGDSELRIRLEFFEDVHDWKMEAWERKENFADVICPNDINVIDYLEIVEEHYLVGKYILDIHKKLQKGIAIIALQKPFGRDTARGGDSSLDKPRLYVALNQGQIKIVDAKNWRGTENPNGTILDFKLYKGTKFEEIGYWRKEMK